MYLFCQCTESCQARGITHCLIVHAGMCLSIWMISNKLILVSYDHPNFANHPRLKYTPVYMCPNLQCRLKLIPFQSVSPKKRKTANSTEEAQVSGDCMRKRSASCIPTCNAG